MAAICGFARATPEAAKQREPTSEQPVKFALEPTQSQMDAVSDSTPEQPQAEVPEPAQAEAPLGRSARICKPIIGNRLVDALDVQVVEATVPAGETESSVEDSPAQGELFSHSTLFALNVEEELELDPIQAHAASADPDTLYHHKTMRETDKAEFLKAMEKEFIDQWENDNFKLKRRTDIPEGARVVWAMKRKRKVLTGEVYKHKARMNLDGSKQLEGIDYNQTYSPTASWPAVRL